MKEWVVQGKTSLLVFFLPRRRIRPFYTWSAFALLHYILYMWVNSIRSCSARYDHDVLRLQFQRAYSHHAIDYKIESSVKKPLIDSGESNSEGIEKDYLTLCESFHVIRTTRVTATRQPPRSSSNALLPCTLPDIMGSAWITWHQRPT